MANHNRALAPDVIQKLDDVAGKSVDRIIAVFGYT
ncbi:hypothetical protein C8N35_1011198 [Breoghania corrubedonensis]|uniref:Uncharacterized protein n=1 Tax=Breoghania corrubedonensis TaxID=665038 RepID=A0A2T5VHC5_9HYPH|nr:hypothetical protein C8N35_1011198 [Breoghania corrubedonensis]